MGKKVLLLHGWGGSDYPHWQSWLAGELAKDYGCVNFLKFSEPDTPKLDLWISETLDALQAFQPDIVICHSLANTLWFHLCNKHLKHSVEHLYLVAPPSMNCAIEDLKEFFPLSIPSNLYAHNAMLIYSTNDPYMPLDEAISLQNQLQIPTHVVEHGGHLNVSSGFGAWEWLLGQIKFL